MIFLVSVMVQTHALYPQFVSTMFQPQLWYALLGLGKTNFS